MSVHAPPPTHPPSSSHNSQPVSRCYLAIHGPRYRSVPHTKDKWWCPPLAGMCLFIFTLPQWMSHPPRNGVSRSAVLPLTSHWRAVPTASDGTIKTHAFFHIWYQPQTSQLWSLYMWLSGAPDSSGILMSTGAYMGPAPYPPPLRVITRGCPFKASKVWSPTEGL